MDQKWGYRRAENVFRCCITMTNLLVPISRLKTHENFPLYSFPKNESISAIWIIYELNFSLKEYFVDQLSLIVVCEKADCSSSNPFLQNRIWSCTVFTSFNKKKRVSFLNFQHSHDLWCLLWVPAPPPPQGAWDGHHGQWQKDPCWSTSCKNVSHSKIYQQI